MTLNSPHARIVANLFALLFLAQSVYLLGVAIYRAFRASIWQPVFLMPASLSAGLVVMTIWFRRSRFLPAYVLWLAAFTLLVVADIELPPGMPVLGLDQYGPYVWFASVLCWGFLMDRFVLNAG